MKSAITLRPDEQMLFTCKCGDPDHQFILGYNNDETEVFISVHLVREQNIFKRIWIAMKYVFGRRSIYGGFAFHERTHHLGLTVTHWMPIPPNYMKKNRIGSEISTLKLCYK